MNVMGLPAPSGAPSPDLLETFFMNHKTLAALALLSLAAAGLAQAQPMRCRNDLAQVGDSKASVLHKCGEPASKDSFCKPADQVNPPAGAASVTVVPCERV